MVPIPMVPIPMVKDSIKAGALIEIIKIIGDKKNIAKSVNNRNLL
ncbi:hypothetical protein NQU17_04115 [Clostridiaceae bacterium HFYG-1003]|nr:hypothetical protein NQU17_04115 [Clostridiaceae bacterium HFYG-1003]